MNPPCALYGCASETAQNNLFEKIAASGLPGTENVSVASLKAATSIFGSDFWKVLNNVVCDGLEKEATFRRSLLESAYPNLMKGMEKEARLAWVKRVDSLMAAGQRGQAHKLTNMVRRNNITADNAQSANAERLKGLREKFLAGNPDRKLPAFLQQENIP